MFEEIELGGEFFERLTMVDAEITASVAAAGVPVLRRTAAPRRLLA